MAQILKYVIGKDYRPLTVLEAKGGNTFTPDYDKSNWVQARQYEDGLRQVFVEITNEDGSPYDLTGANVLFEGILPDNEHKILDNSHAVFYEDPTSGKFRFDLPAAAFAVAGQYKQAFFRITKGYQNVATLEFKLEVLADMVISGLMPSDYISPLDELFNTIKETETKNVAELKKIVDNKVAEITNLMTALNQTNTATLSELNSAKTALEALEDKIKQDGLFTKEEADSLENTIKNGSINQFSTVSDLKESDLVVGDVAKTIGFYSENDGGGALYVIRGSKSEMNHFEDLNNGKFAELVHQNSQINVKQLGAYGDGSHEDTSKIQEAVDLIGKHRIQSDDEGSSVEKKRSQWSFPSTIFFPNGVYLTGQISISIGSLSLKGARTTPWSRGSILLAKPGLTTSVLDYTLPNASVFTDMIVGGKIEDLAILGSLRRESLENSANASGISIENLAECNISNVYIANFKKGGILARDWWDSTVTGLEIRGCGTDATFASLDLDGDDDSTNSLHFFGLHIEGSPYMLRLGKVDNVQFVGSKFESSGVRAYRTSETENPYIKISENTSQTSFGDCFFTFNYGLGMLNSGNAIVSNSHFYAGTSETTNAGTVLKSEKNGIFSGNIFDGFLNCSSEIPVIDLGENNIFTQNRVELADAEAFVKINTINTISENRINGYNLASKGISLLGARNVFTGNNYINFTGDVFDITSSAAQYQSKLDNRVDYPVETSTIPTIRPKSSNTSNPLTWYYTGSNDATLSLDNFADKDDDYQLIGYEFRLTTNHTITIPGSFDSFSTKTINPGQTAVFVKVAQKNKWRISVL
ncbi:BppU family phage baseplate upper protein [Ligilactobacillus equi]|uniref:BppU family phage baseplate upper protein n=1 Tax=Ligilactobacillus equi TaxID=137357 RepID=UPI002ED4235F